MGTNFFLVWITQIIVIAISFNLHNSHKQPSRWNIRKSHITSLDFSHPGISQLNRGKMAMVNSRPHHPTKIKINEQNWKVLPDVWDSLARIIPNNIMLTDPIHDGFGNTTVPSSNGPSPGVQLTFSETNVLITRAAAALQSIGLVPGDCVSIFSENSHRWFIIEQAIMKAGGCNAVRGSSAPEEELRYIFQNSRSVGVVCETTELLHQLYNHGLKDNNNKNNNNNNSSSSSNHSSSAVNLRTEAGPKFAVVLYGNNLNGTAISQQVGALAGSLVFTFEELLALGSVDAFRQVVRDPESTATLVYTSGTTSKPKGVLLRHRNLIHQVYFNSFDRTPGQRGDPNVGDVLISILPCWHIFERTSEYFFLARGAHMVYSNLRNFRKDLPFWRPHFVVVVPRLIENIQKNIQSKIKEQSAVAKKVIAAASVITRLYLKKRSYWRNLLLRDRKPRLLKRLVTLFQSLLLWPLFKLADLIAWRKIRSNLGGRIKVLVSGGSSLGFSIEQFFEMIGLKIIAGYGLTETSPVIASRAVDRNTLGTVGKPVPGTAIKIVHPETKREVPIGHSGVLMVKGPQVMAGYMQNPDATSRAFDSEGYFDTGDLAKINYATGDLIITGRSKDTIVLSNGENVEPAPIEEAIVEFSPLVDQVMLVGQDQRYLGALVVVNPVELSRHDLLHSAKAQAIQTALGSMPLSQGIAGDVEFLREQERQLNDDPVVSQRVLSEITKVCERLRLRPWERISNIHLLFEPFTVPNGLLTQTLKVKRHAVSEKYSGIITKMFSRNGSSNTSKYTAP